ncbi:MAG: DUF6763 family protein [Panacagrimonas sp.]
MAQWLRDASVGEWFVAGGEPFEIVGIDVDSEVVLIQHFDGALEEVEFDSWLELNARQCAPPEDYSGALDVPREDYGLDLDLPNDGYDLDMIELGNLRTGDY